MADPLLVIYVTQALRSGLKPDALRKAMHVSGWDDAEIDAVFLTVGPVRTQAKHAAKARVSGVALEHPPHRGTLTGHRSLALAAVVMGFIVVETGAFLRALGM